MFSFIFNFFAKRRALAAERERLCNDLVERLGSVRAPESFDDKEGLKRWCESWKNLYEKVDHIDVRIFRKTENYKILVACWQPFLKLWEQVKVSIEKIEYQEKINALKIALRNSLIAFGAILKDPLEYANEFLIEQWRKDNVELVNKITNIPDREISGKADFLDRYNRTKFFIDLHNECVRGARIADAKNIIGTLGGFYLDEQQLGAVIDESHSQLVLAGAGTGKTSTILGRIKYLLKKDLCKPEEILVLAFNKSIAKEMSSKAKKEIGFDIECSTFHSFGLGLLKQVDGIGVSVFGGDNPERATKEFVKNTLTECCKDDRYFQLVLDYLTGSHLDAEDFFNCSSDDDYLDFCESLPCTLKGEEVKSKGELDIANFLFVNGIDYKYEDPYCVNTKTSEYPKQYCPDFHLLGDFSKVFIEYFGIDCNGNVPPYFSSRHGKSPSEEYNESIQWKRVTHVANGTILVESFAYEKFEGTLLDHLQNSLNELGVELHPKTNEEIQEEIFASKNGSSMFDGIVNLMTTLLGLTKTGNYTIDDLYKKNQFSEDCAENLVVLDMFKPIYEAYEEHLKYLGQIDFNDMINRAAECAASGLVPEIKKYRYVIVDEYQDISRARNSLLYSMRMQNNFNLLCVGDDWQSIYRFTGSDIDLILSFERIWQEFGTTQKNKIETTYRYPQKLADIAGQFVMKNRLQEKKSIKCGGKGNEDFVLGMIPSIFELRWRLEREFIPDGSSVLFLGRNKKDVEVLTKMIKDKPFNVEDKGNKIVYCNRPNLSIKFKTIHSSKGLEADYVFILNNRNTKDGFPNRKKNPSIVTLLQGHEESFPYAEERRLFYVALTRAKKKAYLVRHEGKKSCFYEEIREEHKEYLKAEIAQFLCPCCRGKLRLVDHNRKWGCSNYSNSKINCNYMKFR